MDTGQLALLMTGSVAAGMINALAGGGSLVTLPLLLGLGLPPTTATATNAVAAWSGLLGGTLRCRATLAPYGRSLRRMAALSIVGGALGGGLMLATPRAALQAAMPWLILVATLTFLFAPWIVAAVGASRRWDLGRSADLVGWRGVVHFAASVVTGYFNPAGGVMMVAAFHAFGIDDLRLANALKIVLGMTMTGASVLVFCLSGAVDWPIALLMIVGTVAGGWLGAAIALIVDRRWIRGFVLAWGGLVTAALFAPL